MIYEITFTMEHPIKLWWKSGLWAGTWSKDAKKAKVPKGVNRGQS